MKFQHQDMLALNASPIFKKYFEENQNPYNEEVEKIKKEKLEPIEELENLQAQIESNHELKIKLKNMIKFFQTHPEEIGDDILIEALMLLKL